ncbi:HAD family hydrolase [Desulfovulcanus sp.]
MFICNALLKKIEVAGLKGIIFDCDGVLFDSREVNVKYYNMIKDALGLPPMNKEEEEYVHMHSVDNSLKFIVPDRLSYKLPEVRRKIDYKVLIPYMRPEDGLLPLLQFLRQKKIACSIFTNRTTTMEMVLRYFHLSSYFNPVITASKVSQPKPNPEGLFKILRRWSYRPEQVVFIGDSELDQETARKARVPFWGFKNPRLHADMYIPDFWTMREYLMQYLK